MAIDGPKKIKIISSNDDDVYIIYNNDVSLDVLKTIDFNNDTQMTDLTDIDKIDLK